MFITHKTKSFIRILLLIMFLTNLGMIQVSSASSLEFFDDFESYDVGTNPSDLYDYHWLNAWGDSRFLPDLYKVGMIGTNKVLQFYSDSNSVHFPKIMKTYKEDFTSLSEAGATFYRTSHSMGLNSVIFGYQDDLNYYEAQAMYNNKLYIASINMGVWNSLGEIDLWGDGNILDINPGYQIGVKIIGDILGASITRLDTNDTKLFEIITTQNIGGSAGFGSFEDVVTGTYINVDDFYVRGDSPNSVPEPTTILLLGSGLVGMIACRRKMSI